MPALKNSQHELFAQRVAQGEKQVDAYRAEFSVAGCKDKTVHEKASRLASKVRARIEEIQKQASTGAAIRAQITAESLCNELEEARQRAILMADGSTEVRAVMGKAQITGHLVDPRKNQKSPLTDASDAEVLTMVKALGKELGVDLSALDLKQLPK